MGRLPNKGRDFDPAKVYAVRVNHVYTKCQKQLYKQQIKDCLKVVSGVEVITPEDLDLYLIKF